MTYANATTAGRTLPELFARLSAHPHLEAILEIWQGLLEGGKT